MKRDAEEIKRRQLEQQKEENYKIYNICLLIVTINWLIILIILATRLVSNSHYKKANLCNITDAYIDSYYYCKTKEHECNEATDKTWCGDYEMIYLNMDPDDCETNTSQCAPTSTPCNVGRTSCSNGQWYGDTIYDTAGFLITYTYYNAVFNVSYYVADQQYAAAAVYEYKDNKNNAFDKLFTITESPVTCYYRKDNSSRVVFSIKDTKAYIIAVIILSVLLFIILLILTFTFGNRH